VLCQVGFMFVIIEFMQLGVSALCDHFVLAPRAERALCCVYAVYANLPSAGRMRKVGSRIRLS
jgi:hypothetical protein